MTTSVQNPTQASAGPRAVWAHWVLKTAQADRLIRWYSEVFGASVVHASERVVFLSWDAEHHRLAVVRMPKPLLPLGWIMRASRKFYRLDHIAFSFPSLQALLELYRRLALKGIKPVWSINHGPTTSIYYEDPDGNRLEFQCDNFSTVQDCTKFMEGPVFRDNPIGVNFDPDFLYERMQQGVPEAELLRQGAGTPPGKKLASGMRAINWRTL